MTRPVCDFWHGGVYGSKQYDTAYEAVRHPKPPLTTIERLAHRLWRAKGGNEASIALGLSAGLLIARHDLLFGMSVIEELPEVDDASTRTTIEGLIAEVPALQALRRGRSCGDAAHLHHTSTG